MGFVIGQYRVCGQLYIGPGQLSFSFGIAEKVREQ